ncbi:MAG TPA: ABC transporter substrate-binding protein, partial [Candidatus Udaeobacter sp.]|nr:ABC transporter substrate-binding protein [Candidatus Udaeobacter sp.]
DARTLVLRLIRPDSLLLRKLSLPGVSSPWKRRGEMEWNGAIGLGPFHVTEWEAGRRLTLVRSGARGRSDTVRVRFVAAAARVRNLLRAGRADLIWPVPPALLDQSLPVGFHVVSSRARPGRDLLLVQRADVPPTTGLPARGALAHALNRSEIVSELGAFAEPSSEWMAGAPPFEAPKFDAGEVAAWLDRGHLGRSFHVALAFDDDGIGAVAARALQGGWSRFNLYAELRALRGAAFSNEALRGQSQLVLIEHQPLLDRPEWAAEELVMPLRGPAVGAFRTGWRTREFDAWRVGRGEAPNALPAALEQRIEEEALILPLGRLPWLRAVREAGPVVPFHPHFGPDFLGDLAAPPASSPSGR